MLGMFRRLFSRKRECPECGYQGSSRDFKRVTTSNANTKRPNKASCSVGAGTSGTSGTSGTYEAPTRTRAKYKESSEQRRNRRANAASSGTSGGGTSGGGTSGSKLQIDHINPSTPKAKTKAKAKTPNKNTKTPNKNSSSSGEGTSSGTSGDGGSTSGSSGVI